MVVVSIGEIRFAVNSFLPTVGSNNGFVAVQSYNYDSLNRLKDATENVTPNGGSASQSWKQTFTFDRYGNRRFDEANTTMPTSFANQALTNPTISTSNNRLTSTGWTYDSAGNTVGDPDGRQFTYDGENKQVEVKNSGNSSIGTYFFDGDGKRVKKVVPSTGETTIFVYDAAAKLIGEYSTIVQSTNDAKVQYLTQDNLGTPRINTDAIGAVTSRSDHLPYGEELTTQGNRSSTEKYQGDSVRQGFTGYESDGETNLEFAQARMYAKNLGRFQSPDPANYGSKEHDPQSWNGYAYSRNNPAVLTDPEGLEYRICNAEGQCWTHDDADVAKSKKAGGADYVGSRDSKTGLDSGVIYDDDGNQVGTYQQISHDNPVQRMVWGGAHTIDTWKPVIEFLEPSPGPGGVVIGGIKKVSKGVKVGKGAKSLWKATKATRPLGKMGHASKHLKDFQKLDPDLGEDDVAKILQYVRNTGKASPTANNATKYEAMVEIGEKTVKVKVIESAGGVIKTGFPVD